jgi:ParB-like chromosome segregation protein Spo0J
VKKLAEEIKETNEINPLIVVIDNEGLYVLEGGHRLAALHLLGKKTLPALVVRDLD